MRPESRKNLYDMRQAAESLIGFITGKTFDDYLADNLLRSAVERQLMIIGEAVSQLTRTDLETAQRVPDFRRIIAFRNILVHGYADVDDLLVWSVVTGDLEPLREEIERLLDQK